MPGRLGRPRAKHEIVPSGPLWRGFRLARHALWVSLVLLVVAGAVLHDVTAQSLTARLAWLLGVVLLIGVPLRHLFGFRCPRCRGVYLATGGLRDFLGLGRILWANRCGSCALEAGQAVGHVSEGPKSRPAS